MKIRSLSIIAALALTSFASFAQSSTGVASMPSSIPTFAMPFMSMDVTAPSAARAGADLLLTSTSSSAAYANPGTIPYCDSNFEVGGSFYGVIEPNPDFWYSGSAALKLGNRVGLAVGYSHNDAQEMEIMDKNGVSKGTFQSSNRMIRAGLGIKTFEWLSFGATACMATQNLTPEVTLSATAFDIYATGVFVCGLKAALGVTNLGPDVENAAGVKCPLPGAITSAIGYEKTFGKSTMCYVDTELKADFLVLDALRNSRSVSGCPMMLSAGVTAGYYPKDRNGITMSLGYHYGSAGAPVPSYATLGVDLIFKHVKIDVTAPFANPDIKKAAIATLTLYF